MDSRVVKIGRWEVAKISRFADKKTSCAVLVRAHHFPHLADRAQNFLNVVNLSSLCRCATFGAIRLRFPGANPEKLIFLTPKSLQSA